MFDREIRYLEFSDRWLRDYRLEGQDIRGKSHYDVFPEVPERWKVIHQRCLHGAIERCEEEAFPRLDGTTDWLCWEVRPWQTAEGSIGGIIMLTEVITARKLADLAVEASERRFRTLFETAPVGIFQSDAQGQLILANRCWSSICGRRVESLRDVPWTSTLHPDDVAAMSSTWRQALRKQQSFTAEFRWRRPDRVDLWCHMSASPLFRADGSFDGFIGTVVDGSERKEHEAVLQRMASTDELTGVFNRRAFETAIRSEIARARRYGTALSFLLVDLDAFKRVNDEHGHIAGDRVLQETARILQATVRLADTVARWGGEEFAVLLPETGMGDAAQFAERLRQRLGDIVHHLPGGVTLSVTCSIGVAQFDSVSLSDTAFFASADTALFQAKAEGRNRVCLAEAQATQ
jgi:diguanylate cyclase (GGDEF)-like protein/PAS domain S-box-containing protein